MSESLSSILMLSSMPSVNPPSAMFAAEERNFSIEQSTEQSSADLRFNDVFSEELKLTAADNEIVEPIAEPLNDEALTAIAVTIQSELIQQVNAQSGDKTVRPLLDDPSQNVPPFKLALQQLKSNPADNEIKIDPQKLVLVEPTDDIDTAEKKEQLGAKVVNAPIVANSQAVMNSEIAVNSELAAHSQAVVNSQVVATPTTQEAASAPLKLIAAVDQMLKPLANGSKLSSELQQIKQSIIATENSVTDAGSNSTEGASITTKVLAVEHQVAQRLLQPIEQLITAPAKTNGTADAAVVDPDIDPKVQIEQASQLTQLKEIIKQLPAKDQQQLINSVPLAVKESVAKTQQPAAPMMAAAEIATDPGLKLAPTQLAPINNIIPLPTKAVQDLASLLNVQQLQIATETDESLPANDDLDPPTIATSQTTTKAETLVGDKIVSTGPLKSPEVDSTKTVALDNIKALSPEPVTNIATTTKSIVASDMAMVKDSNSLARKEKEITLNKDTQSAEISEDEHSQEPKVAKTTDNFDLLFKKMMQSGMPQAERAIERMPQTAVSDQSLDPVELGQLNQDKKEINSLIAKELISTTKAAELTAKLPLHHEVTAARMLKERVSLMVNGGIQQAVIQLDPEELGGMSIRLQIQNDQMNVQFQVQNPQAKEMLENAMGKLKEMLEQQGIVLQNGDVKQQSKGSDQQFDQQQQHSQSTESDEEFESDQSVLTLNLHKQSSDGIDYYA